MSTAEEKFEAGRSGGKLDLRNHPPKTVCLRGTLQPAFLDSSIIGIPPFGFSVSVGV